MLTKKNKFEKQHLFNISLGGGPITNKHTVIIQFYNLEKYQFLIISRSSRACRLVDK